MFIIFQFLDFFPINKGSTWQIAEVLPIFGIAGIMPGTLTGSKHTGVAPEHSFPVIPQTQLPLLHVLEINVSHSIPLHSNPSVYESLEPESRHEI